jgi:hypothetical protein
LREKNKIWIEIKGKRWRSAPCILRANTLQRPGGPSLDFKCRFYSKRGHARFQYVVYVVRHRLKSSSSSCSTRKTKKWTHVNWPALPKKTTKIGRNKFSFFWKAMLKSLCKQKKNKRHKLDLQDSAEISKT